MVARARGLDADVLRDAFPGLANVVFMNADQIRMLTEIMTSLGGTKRRQPTMIMETPNQPAGRPSSQS